MRQLFKITMGLDVKVSGLEGHQVYAPEALLEMPEVSLPFLMGGTDGTMGLFLLDGPLIDGLIEQQLLGKVLPTERLERPVTSIDAGLSEGFVRALMTRITGPAPKQISGFTPQGSQQDRPALRLALGDGRYDVIEATLDMGPGIKTGRFEIWVPALSDGQALLSAKETNPEMLEILLDCEVELGTRIEGCTTTAQKLMEMEPDKLLVFPKSALTEVALTDCKGQTIARGRLGQLNGERALRIMELSKVFGDRAVAADPGLGALTTAANPPPPIALSEPTDFDMPAPAMGMALDGAADIDVTGGDLPGIDLEMPAMAAAPMDLGGGLDLEMTPDVGADLPAMAAPQIDLGGADGEVGDFPAMDMAALGIDLDE